MVHYDYICDACGFTSEEERGVYKCPKCGNQMRAAQVGGRYGGDSSSTVGRWLLCLITFFVSLFLFGLILGPFGFIGAIIATLIIWRITKKASSDNAIRVNTNANVRNPNKLYTCKSCGSNFYGMQPRCPHCGIKLKYTE